MNALAVKTSSHFSLKSQHAKAHAHKQTSNDKKVQMNAPKEQNVAPDEPTEAETAAYEKAAKEFADTKVGGNAIIPTTEARMKFTEYFVPRWLEDFEGDDWQVAFRLMEEADDNFQFKEKGRKVTEGLLRKDVSMCHIIVQQQRTIKRLIEQLLSIRKKVD